MTTVTEPTVPGLLEAPDTFDSSPVLITIPLRARAGEAPGHAIVVDHGVWATAPFETWLVHSDDGGQSWTARPRGAYGTLVEAQADLLTVNDRRTPVLPRPRLAHAA